MGWDDWNSAEDATYDQPIVTAADLDAPDLDYVRDHVKTLDEDKRVNYLRDLIPRLVELSAPDVLRWRDLCAGQGMTKTDFKDILTEAKREYKEFVKERKKEERAHAALLSAQVREEELAAAQAEGTLIPGPHEPMEVARLLIKSWPHTDSTPHIAWWRGDFYRWTGAHWTPLTDTTVQQRLYESTADTIYRHPNPKVGIIPWSPNRRSIGDLEHALARGVIQRDPDVTDERVIATANGVVDAITRTLIGHHPKRFNLSSLPFAYDENAACPQWLAFLDQVLPGDDQAQMLLQEWFGYVISGRTDLQKILNMFGPKRCGKGTIARIIQDILGNESVTSPKLQSLAGEFGEQPLIGKILAVLSDISWNVRDATEAVEVMKAISGEDARQVNRKNRTAWNGSLGVRFMLMGNDMPTFKDASGALAGRMIHIEFSRSFYGQEDPALTSKLRTELPGILNWALAGLARLTERGKLIVPDSSRVIEGEILRQTSPVAGFLQDRSAYAADVEPLQLDVVYEAYREHSRAAGREHVATKDVFSKELRAAGNGAVKIKRESLNNLPRQQWIYGLAPLYKDALKPSAAYQGGWVING